MNEKLPEVVRATVRGVPDVAAVRIGLGAHPSDYQWFALGAPDWYGVFQAKDVTDRRPLVLIDPEDAVSLLDRLHAAGYMIMPATLTDILRSLAEVESTPPEPQGLGAVVRSEGEVYVRLTQGPGRERWRLNDTDLWRDWSDIAHDAAVLAEGWSE